MTFISYAQNFEDILLWRALKRVDRGFYIDVGANDPNVDSVTRAFYESGWHGINIEPVPAYCDRLRNVRVRDVNLSIAVSNVECEQAFFEIPQTGLSTLDSEVAESHRKSGRVVLQRPMKVMTLNQVCAQYVNGPIHFLKIDVEGEEDRVLRGLDLSVWRPWIIVVESTVPLSETATHQQWEPELLSSRYEHVYSDGLNRYYVSQEHRELHSSFSTPPNFFDNFQFAQGHHFSFPVQMYETSIRELGVKVRELLASAEMAKMLAEQAEARAQRAEASTREMKRLLWTKSRRIQLLRIWWKVAKDSLHSLHAGLRFLSSMPLRVLRITLRYTLRFVVARPWIVSRIERVLECIPRVGVRLRAFAIRHNIPSCQTRAPNSSGQQAIWDDCPSSARTVFLAIRDSTTR